jgi:hypothetical protein
MKTIRDVQGVGAVQFARNVLAKRKMAMPKNTTDKLTVKAEINHGRWIVKCPFRSGAELADKKDALFLCLSCLNEQIGGHWIKVIFPDEVAEIENELHKRKPENQHWQTWESVKDIKKQNKERGVK